MSYIVFTVWVKAVYDIITLMDNQPNFLNNNDPTTPPPWPRQSFNEGGPHKSISHWAIVAVSIISVIGYFMTSYYYALWPFKGLTTPIQTLTPPPSISLSDLEVELPSDVPADWQTYRGNGFEFRYPKDWTTDSSWLNHNGQKVFYVSEYLRNPSYDYQNTLLVSLESGPDEYLAPVEKISIEKVEDDTDTLGYFSKWRILSDIPFS